MLLKLGRLGFEVALQVAHVSTNQQCAVMKVIDAPFTEGIAAELPSFNQNIVASRQLGMQAKTLNSTLNNGKLTSLVVEVFWNNEREIKIAVVMIDRAATRTTTHQVSTVGIQCLQIHFAVRILVLPYHHRATVAPQIQHYGISKFYQMVFDGNIQIWICLVRDNELCSHLKLIT